MYFKSNSRPHRFQRIHREFSLILLQSVNKKHEQKILIISLFLLAFNDNSTWVRQ